MRENHVGTIEHTRKMLAFLETLDEPTETADALIRQYRAEIEGYEYGQRRIEEIMGDDKFHDVAGANV